MTNTTTHGQVPQQPCPTCAALARTVMLDQVSFDRKPDCYGIRQITDDESVEAWEDIRTSPDVAREEAYDMMATGRGEIYEVVPLWTTPQPSPAAQAASSAVLKAIREANMQLVRTGDYAFILVPYKVATAQAAESVPAPQPAAPQGDGVPTWQAAQDPMLECSIQPRPLSHPLAAYHSAMSKGPLHYTWQDKPHRLVYDLIAAVKHYANQAGQAAPAAQGDALTVPADVLEAAKSLKQNDYRGPLAWAAQVIDFVAAKGGGDEYLASGTSWNRRTQTTPPAVVELLTDEQKFSRNPYKHSRSAASIWLNGFAAAELWYRIGIKKGDSHGLPT